MFATQRLTSSGSQKSNSESRLLQHLWTTVHVEPPSHDEIVHIIQRQFPSLALSTRPLLAVFEHISSPQGHKQSLSRPISIRDLFKWCTRIVAGRFEQDVIAIFKEAYDCFCAFNANSSVKWTLAETIAQALDVPPAQFSHFKDTEKVSYSLLEDFVVFGRVSLARVGKSLESLRANSESQGHNFAYSRQVLQLLEQLSTCVSLNEPVLLVGETGTGKTTSVGQLASLLRRTLIVVNMSQQSDSADLLGGFKPVDIKTLVAPILDRFEQLFFKTFSRKQNTEFMNKTKLAFIKAKWPALLKIFRNSMTKVHERIAAENDIASTLPPLSPELKDAWMHFEASLSRLQVHIEHENNSFAFSFVEGSLVKALRAGHWVLLDEINLASTETLECLNGLLDGVAGSILLTERGDMEPLERHPDFRLFACMNPATDVGKKNLPPGLRNRFTEVFVSESEVCHALYSCAFESFA
jgi:midasin (ATPase involved in ribosome maturation)